MLQKYIIYSFLFCVKIKTQFFIYNITIHCKSNLMPILIQHSFIIISILLLVLTQTADASQLTYFIFTPKCYHSLVQSLNFKDAQCIKLTFSKLLGYLLVAGGAIVKFPQIIKILLNKSAYGVSFTSTIIQSMTNWVTIVYSWYKANPFSIYGENVFLLAQNVIIMGLILLYGRNVPKGIPDPGQSTTRKNAILYVVFLGFMFLTQNPNSWPSIIINYVLFVQIALFSTSRLIQIFENYRRKSTGNLAFITYILIFMGNLGRLFTVFVQISNDYLFAFSIILAATLNGTIVLQFIKYWNNSKKVKEN